MTTRDQCQYGFICGICKDGNICLTWEDKEKLKSKHQECKVTGEIK